VSNNIHAETTVTGPTNHLNNNIIVGFICLDCSLTLQQDNETTTFETKNCAVPKLILTIPVKFRFFGGDIYYTSQGLTEYIRWSACPLNLLKKNYIFVFRFHFYTLPVSVIV